LQNKYIYIMENRLGLVQLQVNLIKKDEELIDLIIKETGIKEDKKPILADMLRYNVLTVVQMAELTGMAVSSITNKTRPFYKHGEILTELDVCFPFASLTEKGPKFIARNDKFKKCLLSILNDGKRAEGEFVPKEKLISAIYTAQKSISKTRGYNPPNYSLKELTEWLLSQKMFDKIYTEWEKSGFKRKLRPSCDRLDESKGYSFDNIQILTVNGNQRKPLTQKRKPNSPRYN
jgi:hypothetical protein